MKRNQRRWKKSQKKEPSKPAEKGGVVNPKPNEKILVPSSIADAFGSVSFEEAEEDSEKATQNLRAYLFDNAANPSKKLSSSSISGSDFGMASTSSSVSVWSEGLSDTNVLGGTANTLRGTSKGKRLVAATGTVSTVIGKDYMKQTPQRGVRKSNTFPVKVILDESEETEQFLMSMLGEECDLSLAVIRDVLCECGYNVEMALDVLLDISTLPEQCSLNNKSLIGDANGQEDSSFSGSGDENLADKESECTSNSCDSEFQDSIWFSSNNGRFYAEVFDGSESQNTSCGATNSNASQEILESFYKIYKTSQHEPRTMDWRNIAKKMSSLSSGTHIGSNIAEPSVGEEYESYRKEAQHHWDSMRSTYQKAATAYSKGEKSYAAYLSDQGKQYSKMRQQADERASQEIFRARNKSIENLITIDLHGQQAKEAIRILKLHLLVPSIKKLRVITGFGSHGAGKATLKERAIKLMKKEGIEYVEENLGTLLLKLDQPRDFSFLDSDSETE
ncbi:hypothetical protein SAY86_031755 [Trapa natans]|uniref:Smr domain-containing protein n=1 Tax=Trapa natans TaxID=22666 RepID=A0AAN7R680_TRANT|nr:hypothetical protein SAY86_031755 [Trapa natans]